MTVSAPSSRSPYSRPASLERCRQIPVARSGGMSPPRLIRSRELATWGARANLGDRFSDGGNMGVGGDTPCDHCHRLGEDLDLRTGSRVTGGIPSYRIGYVGGRCLS